MIKVFKGAAAAAGLAVMLFCPVSGAGVSYIDCDSSAVIFLNEHSSLREAALPMETKISESVDARTRASSANGRLTLVPCGTPFGIKIISDGVVVTDYGEFGAKCPGREAGIRKGDVIFEINGKSIERNNDIIEALDLSPEKAHIKLRRGDKTIETEAVPVKAEDGSLRLGLWVRDSSAGIGTMTYYNPADGSFAGLGHAVCDVDTGVSLSVGKGEAAAVAITGIRRGENGKPGELSGSFVSCAPIGSIERNMAEGVFGYTEYIPSENDALPVADCSEIHEGKASILSTISGMSPEEYDIEIESVDITDGTPTRNFVIRVTDSRLIAIAGGIVQGMSGSPIIQDGRLVGAVTHVFVNDTVRGYGIYVGNMLDASGVACSPAA